ncbi:MAG: hypothetical protein VKK80_13595 [Prochlorothrix sp.]|nr:hypothetical protein [Prochlorothrix sp.]
MGLTDLVQAAKQLNEADLELLLQQIAALRAQRRGLTLPAHESDLLDRVNQPVPADLQAEYQILRAKREAETLTETEHQRLLDLSNQIEIFGAKRLEALALLAQLRQVSLPALMDQLGIPVPTV